MQKFIILHTNDIHGRIEGLARITTLIERIRTENPGIPVIYLDAGDSEETSTRLSNLTKGMAMHRLLSVAGCSAATVGNGGILRYSQHILKDYASVARYPHLLANLRNPDGSVLEGAQSTVILEVGTLKLGVIGLTAVMIGDNPMYEDFFGLRSLPGVPLIHELASDLRQRGADVVIVLSHLGMPEDILIPLRLADLGDFLPLIVGAHSHHLAPAGVWSGKSLIVQAGEYAQYLGRLDLTWDDGQLCIDRVSVIPVTEDIPPALRVQEEVAIIEAEVKQMLNDVVGTLAEPLDFATDRECGVTNLLADALRERMKAEVGLVTAGVSITSSLPAGPLKRVMLWEYCSSSANPGVVEMTGEQLLHLVARGLDPAFAAEVTRANRGEPRGLMHLSGACMHDGQLSVGGYPVKPETIYKVAASDWELDIYGGYSEKAWGLKPAYEVSVIMRDVVEDYLKGRPPVSVQMGRLGLS